MATVMRIDPDIRFDLRLESQVTKGHLILKAIYGLLTSSKKRMVRVKSKKANKTNLSVGFLEEVSRP